MITPATQTDFQLERWASIYQANPRFHARGVSFEAFVANPEYYLFGPGGAALYHLTSKEQLVFKAALMRSVRFVANGRVIEKLRHHRWPRRARHHAAKDME